MDEKYVAILYEKFVYDSDNSIFIFKPIGVLSDCTLDYDTDVLTHSSGKNYFSMDDEILAFSEETLCYGFPVMEDELKNELEYLGEEIGEDQLIKHYFESLNETVVFGVYDKERKMMKNILAPKDEIMGMDSDDWFFHFEVEELLGEEPGITISPRAINELLKHMEDEEYETVISYFNNLKNFSDKITSDSVIQGLVAGSLSYNENEKEVLPIEDKQMKKKENTKGKISKETMNELNELVGLDNVKDEIKKLVTFLKFVNKTKGEVTLDKLNLHMVFTGNPGTGKTTVARIISKILYEAGYLQNNKFAEITPKDLIAEYVGQTAVKTSKLIKQNKGGLIFIDEAYVFNAKAQEFGPEAIVEIIKEMEKNETVFIFAGYKDEMKGFINSNPGIASRVGYFIKYDDYDLEQLYEMFELKLKKSGLKIDDKLKDKIMKLLETAKSHKHFGNGRFIDKMFAKIVVEHALNTERARSKEKLLTLTENDLTEDLANDLLYERSEDMFNQEDEEFEKVIDQIAETKTDEVLEQLIKQAIVDKLYDSNYDRISTIAEKKIRNYSASILDDVKENIKHDKQVKVKTKRPNQFGFAMNKKED